MVNIQLEVLGWVEKRNYLESAVQMNGILNDLLLQAAQRQAFFGTLEVTWDVAPVSGIAETCRIASHVIYDLFLFCYWINMILSRSGFGYFIGFLCFSASLL